MSHYLHRNIVKNSKYDKLIKKGNCKKVFAGNGNTFLTIDLMIENIIKNSHQASLLAPVLKTNNLQQTCNNVHSFLYNHFQYKQDDLPQMLRSLECSWTQRFSGIDCKSYSIAAGIILAAMGHKFYIRKIVQPDANYNIGLENFSHVYIIVPVDQQTGTLKQGYYTIDGTLKTTTEPPYITEKSYFMDMPHYSLNGVDLKTTFNNIKQQLFSTPISCVGKSAFETSAADIEIDEVNRYFGNVLAAINDAVKRNDVDSITYHHTLFRQVLGTSIAAYNQKRGEKKWNGCTNFNIGRMLTVLDYYQKAVEPALHGWLSKYYDIVNTGETRNNISNQGGFESTDPGFYFTYTGVVISYPAPVFKFTLKQGITSIPAFEITPYMDSIGTNPSSFNIQSFLDSLTKVLVTYQNVTGGDSTGSNNGSVYDNENPDLYNQTGTQKQSSMGWILLLLAGGIAYGTTQFKNKKV